MDPFWIRFGSVLDPSLKSSGLLSRCLSFRSEQICLALCRRRAPFLCPARRPLTQIFKQARKMVMADRKVKAAEQKQREAHEAAAKLEAEQKKAADQAAEKE